MRYTDHVDIWALKTDTTYQRQVTMADVKRIMKSFNPDMLGVIILAKRSWERGPLYIIDGQHRVSALKLLQYRGTVPAFIKDVQSIEEEAELYYQYNTKRRPLKSVEKFQAKACFNSASHNLLKEMELTGWKAGVTPGRHQLNFTNTIERAYGLDKESCLGVLAQLRAVTDAILEGEAAKVSVFTFACLFMLARFTGRESLQKRYTKKLIEMGLAQLNLVSRRCSSASGTDLGTITTAENMAKVLCYKSTVYRLVPSRDRDVVRPTREKK